jgi:hypothetical protein
MAFLLSGGLSERREVCRDCVGLVGVYCTVLVEFLSLTVTVLVGSVVLVTSALYCTILVGVGVVTDSLCCFILYCRSPSIYSMQYSYSNLSSCSFLLFFLSLSYICIYMYLHVHIILTRYVLYHYKYYL